MRKFLHIGIPSACKKEGMTHIPEMKLAITDPSQSKHSIEWLYFDYDCPMPRLLQESTHIAYEVEDIDAELKGANILVNKSPLGDKAVLAFIVEEGIPIELIQNLK